ncbi:anti-adapter protein IraP [Enterobacter hormaechei]|uniref:anti-adapter protein IraP n=1 Tax=Enterobacter TaxID=547 RepID=UPI00100DFCB5|nr:MULTISPECIES: anti-adapter protein IraP [Enterobacter cloacae complex]MBT1914404.1 anti-adapter protein IraP [Enterobacter hormaechei subsp. xiangfangensis]RYA71142.1 anti-adapter protein IraP [Enterobacter cloacae complex sp. 2DZ2F16B1]EJD7031044.1 anti-adapter protein IraP [Enterobacter hormaechei]MBQ0466593.1 anti-adapter protein IraP [Enterobacter hormaechei]MBW7730507.1 anti-adapter protein IraP [Enterobacter hormaechei]
MKNLIAELLVKLAQKEEESKELVAQVEALEIVVTALLRQMAKPEQEALIDNVEDALEKARPDSQVPAEDAELLQQYVKKLLRHPRS